MLLDSSPENVGGNPNEREPNDKEEEMDDSYESSGESDSTTHQLFPLPDEFGGLEKEKKKVPDLPEEPLTDEDNVTKRQVQELKIRIR